MSYDIELCVRVEGLNKYVKIAEPELSSPTYNLGEMFRACMDWDYSQSEQDENGVWQTCYYNCSDVILYVERGLNELRFNRKEYEQYNPPNGWGDIDSAISALGSLHRCIFETIEETEIPIEHLWMRW